MNTHHAVLFSALDPLLASSEGVAAAPLREFRLAQYGIDDVRALVTEAHRRPEGEFTSRTLFVATEFITEEAQQALLKIIEEPPLSTRFVFVIPDGYRLLATLESRFDRQGQIGESVESAVFAEFKAAPLSLRMTQIEEATKQKNHLWQASLKKGLVAYLRTSSTTVPSTVLRDLEYVARLLLTRGASNKFLLEHLALTLPV